VAERSDCAAVQVRIGRTRSGSVSAGDTRQTDLVIETGNRQAFAGSPATIAATMNDFVQADASDGFVLVPHITPGGRDLESDPALVATARQYATEQLTRRGLDEAAFVTELVVSELVTNAIRYGGSPIQLRLIRDRALICEVSDASSTSPHLRRARTFDEGAGACCSSRGSPTAGAPGRAARERPSGPSRHCRSSEHRAGLRNRAGLKNSRTGSAQSRPT
jgi:hypothetical protein